MIVIIVDYITMQELHNSAYFDFAPKNISLELANIGAALSYGYVYLNSPNPNANATLYVGGVSSTTFYTFLSRLRIAGNDPNTTWRTSVSQPRMCLRTSNASAAMISIHISQYRKWITITMSSTTY